MSNKKNEYFSLGSGEYSLLGTTPQTNNYDYSIDDYNFDLSRDDDSHAAVIRQIKKGSVVLDVGCASGLIGNFLTKKCDCIVDGIEYDKEAAEGARSKNVYRDVYNFSATDVDSAEYKNFFKKNNKYDYIVFADVLEHLVNPDDVIYAFTKLLKTGGSMIISIPNISNLDIIKAVIDGKWNYSEHGLLDTTHLRFFTASSFVDMIGNIEKKYGILYNVKLCDKTIAYPPYFSSFDDYKLFNKDNRLSEYLCLQNIFKITVANKKQNRPKGKEDSYFDFINSEYNRLLLENYNGEQKLINREAQIRELKRENKRLTGELTNIYNSKRWKMMNKILKIFGK